MKKHILKWTVPVDDQPHEIGRGRIVHVDCQKFGGEVQVWTEEVVGNVHQDRWVQVVGTGHEFAHYGSCVGSAIVPSSSVLGAGLVWHVIEFNYPEGGR